MKKKFISLTGIIILILLLCSIISHSNMIKESVLLSVDLWIKRVLPSLFPMFILSDIFIYFGLPHILKKMFGGLTNRLFGVSGNASYIFFMSMICGTPSSAYIAKNMYQNHEISALEAEKALCFSFFSNPLFLLTMFGLIFPNNKILVIKLIFIHYAANIVIGFFLKFLMPASQEQMQKISLTNMSFGQTLTTSIGKSMNTLIMILGTITFYIILTTAITSALPSTPLFKSILGGMLEITQGLNALTNLSISETLKAVIAVSFVSFGGLSIHTQIKSILSDTSISYKPFFYARIAHAFLAAIATLII